MRFPNFYCIGAQRAGTFWLNKMLSEHPQVWVPKIDEVHYYDHLHAAESNKWIRHHIISAIKTSVRDHILSVDDIDYSLIEYLCNLSKDDMFSTEWYSRIWEFAPKDKMCLDVTPEYCLISKDGIDHLKALSPDAKLIYIIRDPAARAASQMRMHLRKDGVLPETIDEWISYSHRPEIEIRGDYISHVTRWRDSFGEDQILFVPYGEIIKNRARFMRRCEDFFQLEHHDYTQTVFAYDDPVPKLPLAVIREFESRFFKQSEFIRENFGKMYCYE